MFVESIRVELFHLEAQHFYNISGFNPSGHLNCINTIPPSFKKKKAVNVLLNKTIYLQFIISLHQMTGHL